jgi:hypothetical protein
MTPREREIKKKYTRVANIADENVLFLSIDQQEFKVEITPSKVKWFQKMLAIALTRMIEKEAPHD